MAGREEGRELVSHSTGARHADEWKIYIRGVTKLRRQRGGHRATATAGEMTLGPRGAHYDLYSGHDLDVGGGGRGGGGIFDQYSEVFAIGGGPLIESKIGVSKALLRCKQQKEHLRLVEKRTGHFMGSSPNCVIFPS